MTCDACPTALREASKDRAWSCAAYSVPPAMLGDVVDVTVALASQQMQQAGLP